MYSLITYFIAVNLYQSMEYWETWSGCFETYQLQTLPVSLAEALLNKLLSATPEGQGSWLWFHKGALEKTKHLELFKY